MILEEDFNSYLGDNFNDFANFITKITSNFNLYNKINEYYEAIIENINPYYYNLTNKRNNELGFGLFWDKDKILSSIKTYNFKYGNNYDNNIIKKYDLIRIKHFLKENDDLISYHYIELINNLFWLGYIEITQPCDTKKKMRLSYKNFDCDSLKFNIDDIQLNFYNYIVNYAPAYFLGLFINNVLINKIKKEIMRPNLIYIEFLDGGDNLNTSNNLALLLEFSKFINYKKVVGIKKGLNYFPENRKTIKPDNIKNSTELSKIKFENVICIGRTVFLSIELEGENILKAYKIKKAKEDINELYQEKRIISWLHNYMDKQFKYLISDNHDFIYKEDIDSVSEELKELLQQQIINSGNAYDLDSTENEYKFITYYIRDLKGKYLSIFQEASNIYHEYGLEEEDNDYYEIENINIEGVKDLITQKQLKQMYHYNTPIIIKKDLEKNIKIRKDNIKIKLKSNKKFLNQKLSPKCSFLGTNNELNINIQKIAFTKYLEDCSNIEGCSYDQFYQISLINMLQAGFLLREGLVHTSLISMFHNVGDNRLFLTTASLLQLQSSRFGTGRLSNIFDAGLYSNFRMIGIADFAEIKPLKSFELMMDSTIQNMQHMNANLNFFKSCINKEKFVLLEALTNQFFSWYVILIRKLFITDYEGTDYFNRVNNSLTDDQLKFMTCIIKNVLKSYISSYLTTDFEEIETLFNGIGIDDIKFELIAKQTNYFLTLQYVKDIERGFLDREMFDPYVQKIVLPKIATLEDYTQEISKIDLVNYILKKNPRGWLVVIIMKEDKYVKHMNLGWFYYLKEKTYSDLSEIFPAIREHIDPASKEFCIIINDYDETEAFKYIYNLSYPHIDAGAVNGSLPFQDLIFLLIKVFIFVIIRNEIGTDFTITKKNQYITNLFNPNEDTHLNCLTLLSHNYNLVTSNLSQNIRNEKIFLSNNKIYNLNIIDINIFNKFNDFCFFLDNKIKYFINYYTKIKKSDNINKLIRIITTLLKLEFTNLIYYKVIDPDFKTEIINYLIDYKNIDKVALQATNIKLYRILSNETILLFLDIIIYFHNKYYEYDYQIIEILLNYLKYVNNRTLNVEIINTNNNKDNLDYSKFHTELEKRVKILG